MLEGEEQVVFWSEDRHVIGDLCGGRRLIAKRNLEEWKTQPHQGRVAKKVGPPLLSYCKQVRRWAFFPEMVMFLVLAICEWVRGRHTHTNRNAAERICIW